MKTCNPCRNEAKAKRKKCKVKCNTCGRVFNNTSHLNVHIRSVHLKLKPHICDGCDAKFGEKSRLLRHINTVHLKLKPYDCDECKSSFSRKSHLQTHINMVHLKLKPYDCDECKSSFSQQLSLQIHINTVHLKLKPYNCDECEISFGQKPSLQVHINAVHLKLKPYNCDECGAYFGRKAHLRVHIQSCTGNINVSGGELACMKALEILKIDYKREYIFHNCKAKRYLPFDFYLPKYDACIEYDGKQHFEPIKYFGGQAKYETRVKYDGIKDEYCRKSNMMLLRIPYTEIENVGILIANFICENSLA